MKYMEDRTIENPIIGDRVTFLQTSVETGGAFELVEVTLQSGGGTTLHYHTTYEEVFEALEGLLYIDCDGETFVLQPGEQVTAPIGSIHRFYNPGIEPIVFLATIKPARSFEKFLRVLYGLARDGRIGPKGLPKSLWDTAVFFHLGETYMPNIPLVVQRSMYGLLFMFAKCFGVHRRLLKKYKAYN